MGLSKIYKRNTLRVLVLVLLLGCISHYLVFTYLVHHSVDEILQEHRQNIEHFVFEHDTLIISDNPVLNNSRLTYEVFPLSQDFTAYSRDTLVYSEYKEEMVVYRLYTFALPAKNEDYLITLWQATVDTEDILLAVVVSLVILFVLFILFFFRMTNWFNRVLWHPFYDMLSQLREVDITRKNVVRLSDQRVDEFKELNHTLNRMLKKSFEDYTSLKELTENTSHELQTPLSVIKAKLELLQQYATDDETQSQLIRTVGHAVDRMSRINRSLLLIAKINNNQFVYAGEVEVNPKLDHFLETYEDIIQAKTIRLVRQYEEILRLAIHPALIDILVSNLLSNAIRYNIPGGKLMLRTTRNCLSIVNTYRDAIPEGDLFARFNRSTQEKEATGLGLSIVKSICEKNNLNIRLEITGKEFTVMLEPSGGITG